MVAIVGRLAIRIGVGGGPGPMGRSMDGGIRDRPRSLDNWWTCGLASKLRVTAIYKRQRHTKEQILEAQCQFRVYAEKYSWPK